MTNNRLRLDTHPITTLISFALLLLPLTAARTQDPACLDAPDGTPNDAVCVVDGVSHDFTEIDTGIFVAPPSPLTAASRDLFAPEGEPGELGALLDELMHARGENAKLSATIERQDRELAELAELRARLKRVEAVLLDLERR